SNPYPTSQSCTVPVNGQCGSSDGQSFTSQPTTNLCSQGTASSVSGSGPWYWTCQGSNGGSTASCSAQKTTPTCTWTCDSWSACVSGIQTRNCYSSPSGCVGSNPYPTSQSCTVPVNGQCGSSDGQSFTSQPTNGLCNSGNPSSVSGSGPWHWTCNGTGGGISVNCSAQKTLIPVNGQCGSSDGGTFGSAPTTNLCSQGTASSVSGSGPWSWACYGINGGSTVSCSAQKTAVPINGQCGYANNNSYDSQPTSGLCYQGTASTVTGSGPWHWTCQGSNGGSTVSCVAQKILIPVYGQCGSSNGQYFTSQPTSGLCYQGTASTVTGSGPWYWTCQGENGGSSANCSASKTSTAVDGQCGSANGGTFGSAPTANLCSQGTASSVSGSGPWFWACYGINGGSTVSCSAQKTTPTCTWTCDSWSACVSGIQTRNCYSSPSGCVGSNPYPTSQSCISAVNGICGPSSGGNFTSQPTTGLCNSGYPSGVTGYGPWYWTCYGQSGGSDASCMAYKIQTNQAPSVYAGSYKEVQSGQSIYLDATASDPQGYSLTYSWNCNGGSLSNYNVLNPTFYAPIVYSNTTYVCTLTVINTVGMSASSSVNIYVRANANYQQPPIVYAGSSKTIQSGQSIYLDATASDPQGYSLTYSWNCNGGSLSNYNVLNPTFYAPIVYSDTTYTCTLTVTNNRGQSSSSSVSIYVKSNTQSYSNLTVTTYNATSVTTNSAVLNGAVSGYNVGGSVGAKFTYGRGNNLNMTVNVNNNLTVGERFSATIYNLEKAKAYSFRAEATGSNGVTVYGNTLKFITAPDSPFNFNAYFNGSNGVNLSWSTGSGACYTVITRKIGAYPASSTDGIIVYLGTGNSYFDQNIYTNKTYYYRAWSVGCDEGLYSWSDSAYAKKTVSTYVETKGSIYVPPVSVVRNVDVQITGKNITKNGVVGKVISAAPGDEVEVNITVSSADAHALENVILTNILPTNIDNVSNIRLNGKNYAGDVNGTILLGTIPINQAKTLTFTIKIGNGAANQTLINKVSANAKNAESVEDMLQINVSSAIVAGATNGEACPSASVASAEVNGGWWWNLLWLLLGLIVGLIIFLIVYFIMKKRNEKKQAEAPVAVPAYGRDRYFSIQQ
ncbi:MAG TPA: PKD domain-containing protein, partial [Candidatus Pacearchaeota archaeon]|nr:PKD domain-containing protein [Candidatus Pacearchaeota archaeon]HQK58370.1 PKD domain-containing protein [Candidatus Pacearchaeota archaeon]